MTLISRNIERTAQPVGPTSAKNDSVLRNFWHCGNGYSDAARSTVIGTPVNVSRSGGEFRFNGTSSEIQLGAELGRLNRDFSVVGIARVASLAAVRTIISTGASGWAVRTNATTGALQFLESQIELVLTGDTSSVFTVNVDATFCVTISADSTAAVVTYVNGIQTGSTTTTSTFSDSTRRLAIGTDPQSNDAGSSWFSGGIRAVGITTRCLKSDEIPARPADIWRLLKPERRRIWVPVSSSLPTLSASTYKPGTLTADGWQPRVTAS